jgi:adenine phosphoribosyltransferase
LEIHRDAFGHPCRVLILDDLLATGGTAGAAVELVQRLQGEVVECAFVIELEFLNGKERLKPSSIYSLIQY